MCLRRERYGSCSAKRLPEAGEGEAIVQAWNRDEPDQAEILRVEKIELRTGTAN
jgi:hypothetical protein